MRFSASIVLLATMYSYAQTTSQKTPPIIPVEVREKFFKAQSEYQNAAVNLREATTTAQVKNTALQEQMEKIKSVCGTSFIPNLDKDGEVVCVEKQKTPEVPKK